MTDYFMLFGSILIVLSAIINLNSFKFKIKEIVLMIALAQIGGSILLHLSEFVAVISIIVVPAIFIYKNSKNTVRAISIPIVSIILFNLSDNIISNICILVFGIPLGQVRQNMKLYFIIVVIDLIFMLLISRLLAEIINKKIRLSIFEIRGKVGLLVVVTLILTAIVFYTNIIFGPDQKGKTILVKGLLFATYFVMLIIVMYVLFTSIKRELDLKSKQIQFDSLQEYTGSLEKLYTDMRAFRHDYINILSSMIGYIENKDIASLEKYFNDKILPLSKGMESNNFKLGTLKNLKIPEIKGIISSKLIRAQELNIDVLIEAAEPIENVNIDIIDLSRIVGILLDNAIEAAVNCEKPCLKLALIKKENSVLIVVINSLYEEVPIHKIYQKGFSTKGSNRGIGLYNLKQILEGYENVTVDTLIENGEFKQLFDIAND